MSQDQINKAITDILDALTIEVIHLREKMQALETLLQAYCHTASGHVMQGYNKENLQ